MKHGMSGARIYQTWTNMKARCYKEYDRKYKFYGGKGIKVCDEWLNDFNNFYDWAMQNGYTDEMTIDRIDSEKDYCPENCRWIPMGENLAYSHGKTKEQWIEEQAKIKERDYKKESAWERKAYQIFSFKARKDNGEAEKLKKAMGDGSFADWVRKHLENENK